jgi:hypothetical protein
MALYDNFVMKASLTGKFPTDFLDFLLGNPEASVAAIVRCQELHPDYVAAAETVGLVVVRRLRLIQGLAVQGYASDLLKLSEKSWVLGVEPDEPVHTMRQEASK